MPPPTLAPYQIDLPIPPVLPPRVTDPDGTQHYRVTMRRGERVVHPLVPPTPYWGYEGLFPGPTIEVPKTSRVVVEFVNDLPPVTTPAEPWRQWPFAVPSAAGAFVPPHPWTVAHLHGSPSPADADGWTDNAYFPGGSNTHHYPPQGSAALLWYHDHAHMITRLNVYAGLAGLYLVRDPAAEAGLPVGPPYEIPLVIQDRSFEPTADGTGFTGRFAYQDLALNSTFAGTHYLVNGAVAPRVEVRPGVYRLRILNGSNTTNYQIAVKTPDGDVGNALLTQVGVDGGFLTPPYPRPSLREWGGTEPADPIPVLSLFPAERADVLLDLTGQAGKDVELVNYAVVSGGELVRFEVRAGPPTAPAAAPAPAVATTPPAARVRSPRLPAPAAEAADAPVTRRVIALFPIPHGGGAMQTINGRTFHETVEETPTLSRPGDVRVEEWEFLNLTGEPHPMHIHLVHFVVMDRRPVAGPPLDTPAEQAAFLVEFRAWQALPPGSRPHLPPGCSYTAPAYDPDPNERGPKDTVRVPDKHAVRVRAEFKYHTGMYMYHCHILEHEDMDMMRPLLVVPPGMHLMGSHPPPGGGHGHDHHA